MSEGPSSTSQLETIQQLIKVYEKPAEDRVAKDSLLFVADMVRILEPEGHGMISHALESLSPEVDDLLAGMRSQFEALLGQTIGRLVPQALRELERKIEVHTRRISILDSTDSPSDKLLQLKATGWETHLSRTEWIASEHERGMAKQTEVWLWGKVEHEMSQLQSLFDRFVTHEGALGLASDESK